MKWKSCACIAFLFASCLITSSLQAQTSYNLTVKAGPLRQSFAGFGASQASTTWSNISQAPRNTMADMVYRDLKMNVLRLWVTTVTGTGVNATLVSVPDMLAAFNTTYVASHAISDIKSRGVSTLLLAPCNSGTATPVPLATYADHLAELILQIKTTYGIHIDVTGISNEPSGWSAADGVACVNYLRAGLDARGLTGVKIIAPEMSSPAPAVPYVDAMRKDPTAWANLFGIASHSYGQVLWNDEMGDRKNGKQWWTTEASANDVNEQAEDENQACTILSRYLCEMNHGVDEWIFFIGLGQNADVSSYGIGTAFLMMYDLKTSSIVTMLKYYYFKQALNTFDVGCVFRKCVSATEGDMFCVANQNPAINAASAYNPDGSWGINVVNNTGVNNSLASSTNLFYPATTYNVTLTVEELANAPSMDLTVYRSRANNHCVSSGTITLVHGVATLAVAPKEIVSLRSGPTALAIAPAPDGLRASTINAPVSLAWNNTMQATSWHVKRATLSGGPYTTIATTTTTEFADHTALNGVVYYYVVAAVNAAGESADSAEVVTSRTPFPWINADIGVVGVAGSCDVADSGAFTIHGAGTNLCSTADAFNYTYKTMTGDGALVARMSSLNRANALVGIMMSDTLGTAPKAACVIYNNNGVWLQAMMGTRTTEGAGGIWTHSTITAVPTWLKLVRSGTIFTGYASADGAAWTAIGSKTIAMGSTIYVGLVDCLNGSLCQAAFDNVQAPCAAPTGLSATPTPGQVKLGWTACYGAASYKIKRASASGGPYVTIGIATSPAVDYTDRSVVGTTNYFYVVSAVNATGESPDSAESAAALASLWINADIGVVGLVGSCVIADNGIFTTHGAGGNLGTTADSYNFTYTTLTGDGSFIARMTAIDRPNARAGILMCETLATAPKAACMVYNNNGRWLQAMMGARTTEGAGANWSGSTVTAVPTWLKLARTGNTITGYASSDGLTWATTASSTISMAATIYVGLVDCMAGSLCQATFDNVTGAPIVVTSAWPAAGGTTAGGGAFTMGDRVTVHAIPSAGYVFTNWTEGSDSISTAADYSFTYAAPRQLVANFQQTPWAAWQSGRFSAAELQDPAVSGALQTPEHDGICNLLKYAFRLDRLQPDRSRLPKVAPAGNSHVLTYVRNKAASDLTYVVEVSSTLQIWNSGASFTTDPVLIGEDAVTQTLQVTDLTPRSSATSRFMRVRVIGP